MLLKREYWLKNPVLTWRGEESEEAKL